MPSTEICGEHVNLVREVTKIGTTLDQFIEEYRRDTTTLKEHFRQMNGVKTDVHGLKERAERSARTWGTITGAIAGVLVLVAKWLLSQVPRLWGNG